MSWLDDVTRDVKEEKRRKREYREVCLRKYDSMVRGLLMEIGERFWKGHLTKGYHLSRIDKHQQCIIWVVGKGASVQELPDTGGAFRRFTPHVRVMLNDADEPDREPSFDVEAYGEFCPRDKQRVLPTQADLQTALKEVIREFVEGD